MLNNRCNNYIRWVHPLIIILTILTESIFGTTNTLVKLEPTTSFVISVLSSNKQVEIPPFEPETAKPHSMPNYEQFDWNNDRQKLQNQISQISDNTKLNYTKSEDPDKVRPIIRILDFSDAAQPDIDLIKGKYQLVTARQYMDGSAGQNFIGTTIDKSGERYYAHGKTKPGFYDVFIFSPESLKKLCQCERNALTASTPNLDNNKNIRKIVFGIIKLKDGNPDLGVKEIIRE